MWKALVHVRRSKGVIKGQDYCILNSDQPGGYIQVEANQLSQSDFENSVREYLEDYGVSVVEILEVEEVKSKGIVKQDCDGEVILGTLHTYGVDDA
jgi:hypothetical protein